MIGIDVVDSLCKEYIFVIDFGLYTPYLHCSCCSLGRG